MKKSVFSKLGKDSWKEGSDGSDSDGGDVRNTWNELGHNMKRRILAKIGRDMCKAADKRGTQVCRNYVL